MRAVPLAESLRPRTLAEFSGIEAIDSYLVNQLLRGTGRLPSLLLWGPPGSGKTTLAKLIGGLWNCHFIELSAVLSGVKDVREVVAQAKQSSRMTLLFVDEIHRFTKAQQDAFLPHIEAGVITLIGATTENPSFYLTGALLSRCRTVVLQPLSDMALLQLLARAEEYSQVRLPDFLRRSLVTASNGDGRCLLNTFESLLEAYQGSSDGLSTLSEEETQDLLQQFRGIPYDRDGEQHYNLTSAFIKSLRGSDADAALYYGFRMVEGGEDPRFLIRRMIVFASEDVGNADPRALQLAVSTLQAFELLGLPEGRIPLAQCISYLATAPKSNRSYVAMHRALQAVHAYPSAPVPMRLRNAETALMKSAGYGRGYRYPHDEPHAYVANERYLPDEVSMGPFYEPSDRGAEKVIRERQAWLRSQGAQ